MAVGCYNQQKNERQRRGHQCDDAEVRPLTFDKAAFAGVELHDGCLQKHLRNNDNDNDDDNDDDDDERPATHVSNAGKLADKATQDNKEAESEIGLHEAVLEREPSCARGPG